MAGCNGSCKRCHAVSIQLRQSVNCLIAQAQCLCISESCDIHLRPIGDDIFPISQPPLSRRWGEEAPLRRERWTPQQPALHFAVSRDTWCQPACAAAATRALPARRARKRRPRRPRRCARVDLYCNRQVTDREHQYSSSCVVAPYLKLDAHNTHATYMCILTRVAAIPEKSAPHVKYST